MLAGALMFGTAFPDEVRTALDLSFRVCLTSYH
jgi:hypothetical protein